MVALEAGGNSIDHRRLRRLNEEPQAAGLVVYWMSRDQRLHDNWALLYAQELALELKQPLAVVFCLVPEFLGATRRQYGFMLQGLMELESRLRELNIGFFLLLGEPPEQITRFCHKKKAGALVSDFSPLRISRQWKAQVAANVRTAFYEVDAHNIVPCWTASPKQEYAAYTLRPKIKKLLPDFLTEFPQAIPHPHRTRTFPGPTDWDNAWQSLHIDQGVAEITRFSPGETAAREQMQRFIRDKLPSYDQQRNNPTLDGQSNLSPYLHFGHLSPQRLAYEIHLARQTGVNTDSFLEELVVRRELADNYCFYNEHYDRFSGFPAWAQESLQKHSTDTREYVYPPELFEKAQTHDPLWNAAQREMVLGGKMHGYMRMYWAKKILEWTDTPDTAMQIAIYLNDKYSLDGRDPNGYAGIAWSIGGVHDRAWSERHIFGKIRYMSYGGSKSKFNIGRYLEKVAAYGEITPG